MEEQPFDLLALPAEMRNRVYAIGLSFQREVWLKHICRERGTRTAPHNKALCNGTFFYIPTRVVYTSKQVMQELHGAQVQHALQPEVKIIATVKNFDFANAMKFLEAVSDQAGTLRRLRKGGEPKLNIDLELTRPQDLNCESLAKFMNIVTRLNIPVAYEVFNILGGGVTSDSQYQAIDDVRDEIVRMETAMASTQPEISKILQAVFDYIDKWDANDAEVRGEEAPEPTYQRPRWVPGWIDNPTAALLGEAAGIDDVDDEEEGEDDDFGDEGSEDDSEDGSDDDSDMNMSDVDEDDEDEVEAAAE